MSTAEVHLAPGSGTRVSPLLFGALTEHFGRGIYDGIWDNQRAAPRSDVQAAVRGLGVSMFRYPGGCFADWYHWRDGVGASQDRRFMNPPTRMDGMADEALAREMGPIRRSWNCRHTP